MNLKHKYDLQLIGKRITSARQQAGITQEEAAHNTGISLKHYSEIERGISGISVGTLIVIVKYLNTSADYILLGAETEKSPLSNKLKQLVPQQKQYLEEMLDTFINCCLDRQCFPPQQNDKDETSTEN